MGKTRYKFTSKRKIALQRAAEISARKRRKHHVDPPTKRTRSAVAPVKKKGLTRNQKIVIGGAAIGVVALAGVGAAKYNKTSKINSRAREQKLFEEFSAKMDSGEYEAQEAANDAARAALEKVAGNIYQAPDSQEAYDARIKLYGKDSMVPEISQEHEGRPEIFPGALKEVLMSEFQQAALDAQTGKTSPLSSLADDDGFVTVYHRTGGGVAKEGDRDKGEEFKKQLLADQKFKILNRDEQRITKLARKRRVMTKAQADTINSARLIWTSTKLNDSNTRGAFGESVVKLRIPVEKIKAEEGRLLGSDHMTSQGFGRLSSIDERWVALSPEFLEGIKIEDVPASEIKPPPERKFRLPK